MSGDPSKVSGNPKTKTRLEMIYKIMSLLSVLGLGIFAFVTLEQYCANHTGCLKVQYSGSGATKTIYIHVFEIQQILINLFIYLHNVTVVNLQKQIIHQVVNAGNRCM